MILVTGASGYVGHNLIRRLVETGKPVRALVHNVAKAEARLAKVRDKIEIVQGDVTRPATLAPAVEGVSAVIHLVAVAIEKKEFTYEAVNYQGTVNLVDAVKAAGVRRFINMSQNGASSTLPYRFLASKGKAQDYVAASGLDWTAFRPSVIWGPQDEFANVQARLIKLTPFFFPVVGSGKALFQPVYVGDVVAAFALSVDDESTIGQSYELGGPEVLTYQEIVQRVLQALDTHRLLLRLPVPVLRPIVQLMQFSLPNPPVTTSLLDLLKVDNVVEHNALTDVFDIKPRPFRPDQLAYMQHFTRIGSLKRFMGRITADEEPLN
ncbi:MAG TPA: complex I NDUFA9 subunit family protein [Aggregatilineaceae bacterium]|nr:complex I NDUFA9 subunit family protein [Aggregatilineaceae bacterium]